MITNITSLPFVLNDANYLKRLHAALKGKSPVLSQHAKKRMKQRKITLMQIKRCLERSSVIESAHLNIQGYWQTTLGYFIAGDSIKVSAAIEQINEKDFVVVITVMLCLIITRSLGYKTYGF